MGAGSIGSVVGGFLALNGHEVFFLGKGEHTEVFLSKGLSITGIWGEHRLEKPSGATSIEEMRKRGFIPEWTLLCVKSYDTREALKDLTPVIPFQKGIISLQNGLGNIEAIEEAAPGKAVGGRVIFGARTPKPGKVEVTVCADDVLLGPIREECEGIESVVQAFSQSGIPCRFERKILTFIWDKVLYNCCLNALATILKTDYGNLGSSEFTIEIIDAIIDEFYHVAKAEGVQLVSTDPEIYRKRLYEKLIPPTAKHRSSMQEDIEAGRRTEIDALNGAVAVLGKKHGISTPVNQMVCNMIHFLEKNGNF